MRCDWLLPLVVTLEPYTFENRRAANKSDSPRARCARVRSELNMARLSGCIDRAVSDQMMRIAERAKFPRRPQLLQVSRPGDAFSKHPRDWWYHARRCIIGDVHGHALGDDETAPSGPNRSRRQSQVALVGPRKFSHVTRGKNWLHTITPARRNDLVWSQADGRRLEGCLPSGHVE